MDLARRAGVSARAISKLERQGPTRFTLHTLQRICEAAEIDLRVYGQWRGAELDRLLDAGHAALQNVVKRRLEAAGWQVRAEVTFSRFGERGSIDLLAFHEGQSTVLVVEIKTVIADVQGLLRPMDVKVRLAREIAAELGWQARAIIPALYVLEDSTSRRRVSQHEALFGRLALRGVAARTWLQSPSARASGILVFVSPSNGTRGALIRPGRQRVRALRALGSSIAPRSPTDTSARPG